MLSASAGFSLRFLVFLGFFWEEFDQQFKMEDNRFKDIFECFLHNYSGNEYAGFTPEDSHEMGDSSAASVQQDPL